MKKLIYPILLLLVIMVGCGSDDDDNKELMRMYIDISDFTMYRGAPGGAVEVQFNTLKKKELVNKYLKSVYQADEYRYNTIQFNGDKLRYLENDKQIISTYKYAGDSLYIYVRDTVKKIDTLKFVALVDANNNFYREKGLCRYPYSETKDTIRSLDENVTLEKILTLSKYNNLQDMTNPEDTIIWCNVKYLFN